MLLLSLTEIRCLVLRGRKWRMAGLEQIETVEIKQGLFLGPLAFCLGKFIGVNLTDKFLFLFYV